MKVKYLTLSAFLISLSLQAQQVNMFNHYFYKPMIYNPAYAGNKETNVMLISKSQWSGFKQAPQSLILTADGSLLKDKAGLGISMISERKGIVNRSGGDIYYSYRLKINEDINLRLGIAFGIIDQTIDFTKALLESSADPLLFEDAQRKTAFDANAGLAFRAKGFELGLAAPQLLGNRFRYVDDEDVRLNYTQVRHYIGTLKYTFVISENKELSVTPLAMLRYIPTLPVQYNANVNLDWKNKFWVGGTYVSDYAISANAGFHINKRLHVGYSYDFILGKIGKYAGTTNEIMLNLEFGGNKKEEYSETASHEISDSLRENNLVKKLDSLENSLAESNRRLNELDKEIGKVNEANISNDHNPKSDKGTKTESPDLKAGPEFSEKRFEDGTLIVNSHAKEFMDIADNSQPPLGYYVVVGTYFYRDFAIAETQRFVEKGYSTTDWIYSGPENFNYIFMYKLDKLKDALKKVKTANEAGVKDAWILNLTKN